MLLSKLARQMLKWRREEKRMKADGWSIYPGRSDKPILAVQLSVLRRAIWVKYED